MGAIVINTTNPQDQRIGKAFGVELSLGGNANPVQVRAAIISYVVEVVLRQERREAKRATKEAENSVTPIDLT